MSSPELQTIKNCTPRLEIVFKNPESGVIHHLRSEGFIKESLHDDVLNPRSMLSEADKAGMIVEAIRDAVSLDKNMFHTLVAYLRTKGKYYASTVKNLTDEFAKLNGVNPSHGQGAVYSLQGGDRYREGPPPTQQPPSHQSYSGASDTSNGFAQHHRTG